VITGCSGSGKSTALAALEDAGFYCIDNMPILLVDLFLSQYHVDENTSAGFAFGMDIRDKNFLSHFDGMLKRLQSAQYKTQIVFLEADDNILLRRYNQTRRHHPVEKNNSLIEGIEAEKELMSPIRKQADLIVDTSDLSVHELKFSVLGIAQQYDAFSSMTINIVSFGFKYGAPHHADLLIDVRFLANPYFVPELKPKDGESETVADFVLNSEDTGPFLTKYLDLLDYLIPRYEKEGKAHLTIAVGCTGGRHRSVVVAKALYKHIHHRHDMVRLIHRDIQNG